MARNHVVLEDLEAFLQPDLAEQAFAMLDTDGSGKVTLHVRLPALVVLSADPNRRLILHALGEAHSSI